LVAADIVGVAFNFKVQLGITLNDSGYAREAFAGCRLQRVLAAVKQDVGHVHAQASVGIGSLQNLVKLVKETGAELFFLPVGLFSRKPSLLRFGFGFLLFCQSSSAGRFSLSLHELGVSLGSLSCGAICLRLGAPACIFLSLRFGAGFRFGCSLGVCFGLF